MAKTEKSSADVSATYQLHKTDTGSSPVQISSLTARIKHLAPHFEKNHKDNHSRHGLLKIIRKRQKLLQYYKRTSPEAYYKLIKDLGIRDKS